MIRLVWRTDVHLSDQAPASRKDDWADAVFANLDQVKLVAQKVGAHAVIDGGDFFHIKSPSRNTHSLVRKTADHHADYPCPVYCVPGNHDNVYGDYSYLHQQPLGVLYSAGVFNRLYDGHELYLAGGKTYPFHRTKLGTSTTSSQNGKWVGNDGIPEEILEDTSEVIVRVVGIPYHGTKYDMERFTSIQKGEEDYLVVCAHVLASQKGGSMFEGEDIIRYDDLAGLDPDVWMFGHWHKDQGVTELRGTQFINVGSLTRGALTQDNLDRKPATVLLQFTRDEMKIRVLRLRVPSAEEVFDVEAKVRAEARSTVMDAFVASVRQTLVTDKGKSLVETINEMDGVPEKVREMTALYVERAS